MDVGGVDIEGASVDSLDLSAHLLQNFADEGNVADVGYIFNLARLVAENNRRDDRDSRVFRAADINFSEQRLAAVNNEFFQFVDTPILAEFSVRNNMMCKIWWDSA